MKNQPEYFIYILDGPHHIDWGADEIDQAKLQAEAGQGVLYQQFVGLVARYGFTEEEALRFLEDADAFRGAKPQEGAYAWSEDSLGSAAEILPILQLDPRTLVDRFVRFWNDRALHRWIAWHTVQDEDLIVLVCGSTALPCSDYERSDEPFTRVDSGHRSKIQQSEPWRIIRSAHLTGILGTLGITYKRTIHTDTSPIETLSGPIDYQSTTP